MSKKKKTEDVKGESKEKDPREASAHARERTKGEFRHGNYLEDRHIDYG